MISGECYGQRTVFDYHQLPYIETGQICCGGGTGISIEFDDHAIHGLP